MASTITRRLSKQKAAVAAFALLALGLGGVAASGAYFTDQQTITGNTLQAGTVRLGDVGDSDSTAVTLTNALPIDDPQVGSQAQYVDINVRNTGTATFDWVAAVQLPSNATATQTALAEQLEVAYTTDYGHTWSTPQSLASLSTNPTAITSSTPMQSAYAQRLNLRLWLPSTTNNTFQGASLSFDLRVRAIQAGAPGRDTDSSYSPLAY